MTAKKKVAKKKVVSKKVATKKKTTKKKTSQQSAKKKVASRPSSSRRRLGRDPLPPPTPPVEETPSFTPPEAADPIPATGSRFPSKLSIQINEQLAQTIDEHITSLQAAGDYSYVSVSDFIRAALNDLNGGMKLTAMAVPGKSKRTTVPVTPDAVAYWQTLPVRKKTEILERAIRTKLQNVAIGQE